MVAAILIVVAMIMRIVSILQLVFQDGKENEDEDEDERSKDEEADDNTDDQARVVRSRRGAGHLASSRWRRWVRRRRRGARRGGGRRRRQRWRCDNQRTTGLGRIRVQIVALSRDVIRN